MDLKDLIKVIRFRWVSIIAIIGASLVLAFGWTRLQPVVYTADANGIVTSEVGENGGNSAALSYTNNNLISAKLPSYVQLGSLRSVAEYTIEELGLETTPEVLIKQVSVTNPADTNFIRVRANASTPEAARDLASTWVRGIQREVNILESGNSATNGSIYLLPRDAASLPSSPSSPNVKLSLAIGFLGGLVLALGYALLRHFMDRKIRSVEDVERESDVTVLGSLPLEASMENQRRLVVSDVSDSTTDEYFAISEALRELRSNIQFISVDSPPSSIVVTSPLPGDGKSTLAANLASSMAVSGRPTILIDADLRRPMQSNIFNIPQGAGLTDILAGKASLEEAAHQISEVGNLLVIGAGSVPPNPSEILGSERMKNLIKELAEEAFVIVDAPPVIPVTDAAIISTETDGALIVASVGKTTYDVLNKAISSIEKVKGRTLGLVLNRVPRKGMGAGYYGYQYKGSYYRTENEGSSGKRFAKKS